MQSLSFLMANGQEITGDVLSEVASARTTFITRVVVLLVITLAIGLIWISNIYLTDRFSQASERRAERRVALYTGNIVSQLQRNSLIPLLLSRDPALITDLNANDFAITSRRLISLNKEINAASLVLLDHEGRTVAATDRRELGTQHRNQPYYVEALRSRNTVFTTTNMDGGGLVFNYSRSVVYNNKGIGVIVVEVGLSRLEKSWFGTPEAILVTDSKGQIILSSEPTWKSLTIEQALANLPAPTAIERAIQATGDWTQFQKDGYYEGQALLRIDGKIGFQGWRLTYFTTFSSLRERVNGVLAIEIMGFAILVALLFYILSRRAIQQSFLFKRESIELRALNARLSLEIEERERVERHLKVAEQSLAQSSKLAALGEMSAAVSHELNQPLAAMKTYLAGAKLLLQRQRPSEALSSFQRIDDLIGRMASITKQLKSYARKGGDELMPVDLRVALNSGLAMMEPQLNQMDIKITQSIPKSPVMVLGDQLRIEQVVVNLLRNALDAMKELPDRRLDIMLSAGEMAKLAVRDNGSGIDDLEQLFEPFYTTKKPGDGVGLGLAISSGIVTDLGGRLIARNGNSGGAVFEIQLPILNTDIKAAE